MIFLLNNILFSQKSIDSGINKLEEGKVEEAQQIFLLHKDSKKAKLLLGDIASHQKKWDLAIGYYEDLVETDPNSSIYNFKIGGAMGMKALEINKFQAAFLIPTIKDYLEKAVALNPNHIESHRALAELYLQLPGVLGGSLKKSKRHVKALKRLNMLDYKIALALIYIKQDEEKLAARTIKEGIEILQNTPSLALRNYIYFEYAENAMNYGVCITAIPKLMNHYVSNFNYLDLKTPGEAYFRLAQLAYRQRRKDIASTYVQKALHFDASNSEIVALKQAISNM
ncbi:tetratricopeptide repeat protein [Zunongwangia sp.]|uniref:tetratricopeptide repeat protein n=1 Tax=Zunongwangia sp. TaxID=1965325 RepID=UPI003AA84041